ncbi:hypothetical protein D0865_01678 [Hortaea werneckii]|uniref:CENP-V/GFA domain-containing protein n=1 Tax=Hortaea werneckii TaxID=91943 RepID=A0A3M7D745_HORWE|nr:hypothetical protein D0865_01678 [Hortaea werneckii]
MPDFPWPQATEEEATYDLHCHCGTIRYTITISPPLYAEHSAKGDQYPAVECACSWCQRNGEICVHPLSKNLRMLKDFDRTKLKINPVTAMKEALPKVKLLTCTVS